MWLRRPVMLLDHFRRFGRSHPPSPRACALQSLAAGGLLPDAFAIIGIGRREMSNDAFRSDLAQGLGSHRSNVHAPRARHRRAEHRSAARPRHLSQRRRRRSVDVRPPALRRCSPLPDERIALLPLRCVHRMRRSRQLQHGCVLAFAQPGEQHSLPVGELQRIVMHVRLVRVQLPEAG